MLKANLALDPAPAAGAEALRWAFAQDRPAGAAAPFKVRMATTSPGSPESGVPSARERKPGTIDIVRLDLPARIRKLRLDRQLSQAQLADRSGLTARTVHDIESGRRGRVQEQTLILLARGLDLTYEQLLNGLPADALASATDRARRRRQPALTATAFVILAVLGVWAWVRSTQGARAQVHIEGSTVTVRDGLLHTQLWSSSAQATLAVCSRAPWSEEVLLLGRYGDAHDCKGLEARDLPTGDLLWSFTPAIAPAVAVFGPDVFASGLMGCAWFGAADLEGDDDRELLAKFGHPLYYPTCIARLDQDGRALDTYWSRGVILIIQALDADGDGEDEVYLGGTNNSPQYQGATLIVLDREHFQGIGTDVPPGRTSAPGDGSLLRVILPRFPEPIMLAMNVPRIGVSRMDCQKRPEGGLRIVARAGEGQFEVLVTLDERLRILSCEANDMLQSLCTRVAAEAGDPGLQCAAWLDSWRRSRIRLVEGVLDPEPDPAAQ